MLDSFDRAILEALQRDSTLTLRALVDMVHLSQASLQRRIQRLKRERYICAETAVIDPERVGHAVTVLVEVHADCAQSADLQAIKQLLSGPEIQQCYYVTGNADFMLVLTAPSMAEFHRITARLLRDNPRVKWFRTVVVLERVKVSLQVPLQ